MRHLGKNHAWQCQFEWIDISSKKFIGYWEYKKEVKFKINFDGYERSCLTLTFDDLNLDVIMQKITNEMNYMVKHNGLTMHYKRKHCYIDSASSRALFIRGEECRNMD